MRAAAALCAVALLPLAIHAQPRPTAEQARTITLAVASTVASAGTWHQLNATQRRQANIAAADLQRASVKAFGDDVFGPWSACVKMSSMHQEYVLLLNELAQAIDTGRQVTTEKVAWAMRWGFMTGEEFRSCRRLADALEVNTKR